MKKMDNVMQVGKFFALSVAVLVNGCDTSDIKPTVSKEISALRNVVEISIPVKTVTWEMFDWPQYDQSMLPNNPEVVILVAEIEPADMKWFVKSSEPLKTPYIVPGSARPWLSPAFRKMLTTESLDSKKLNCTNYQSKLIRFKESIDGFVCVSGGRVLLYLVVADYSAT